MVLRRDLSKGAVGAMAAALGLKYTVPAAATPAKPVCPPSIDACKVWRLRYNERIRMAEWKWVPWTDVRVDDLLVCKEGRWGGVLDFYRIRVDKIEFICEGWPEVVIEIVVTDQDGKQYASQDFVA